MQQNTIICTLYSLNSYTKLAVFDCVNNTCIHRAVVSSRCTFCASNLGKKIRSIIRNISQLIRSVLQVKLHKCIRALTFYEKSHWILRHRPKWSVLIRQNLLDGLSRLIVPLLRSLWLTETATEAPMAAFTDAEWIRKWSDDVRRRNRKFTIPTFFNGLEYKQKNCNLTLFGSPLPLLYILF